MLGTKVVKIKTFFIINCIVFYEYYKKYFYCFAELHTLSLRFENNFKTFSVSNLKNITFE